MGLPILKTAATWLNDNQGVVAVLIFTVTLALGWMTGIFSALRKRPKFKLQLIGGPTLCCTFPIGKKHENFDMHRTAIALYLKVANVGSAAASIENVSVAYHWDARRFSKIWLKYGLRWFWLKHPVAIVRDFQANIGENVKVYPAMFQRSIISGTSAETYLKTGMDTNGVVYFEQYDAWGACRPAVRDGKVKLNVRIHDVFGRTYTKKFKVPFVDLQAARKYNPDFGKTHAEIEQLPLPFDQLMAQQGATPDAQAE